MPATMPVHTRLTMHAMALDLPKVQDHPNRMPFTGVLTRVGVASDIAPHGSGGKRVLLTAEAAERALPSLLGMGVDLTADLKGHDATRKIGVITGAHVDGDALNCEGFIYAADFPTEALRIHLDQADLGFSFEAQRILVESLDADPLVVTDLCFTGAAILMRDAAAYQSTKLAAAAARRHEMDADLKQGLLEAVQDGIKPVTERLTAVEAAQKAINDRIEANAQTMSKVEPLAAGLEKHANTMEAAGIGLDPTNGHVAHLRRMAGSMRSEAALGRMPAAYSGMGHGYYASGDQGHAAKVDLPDLTKLPAFTDLVARVEAASTAATAEKTAHEAALKAASDEAAALKTQLADLKAAAEKGVAAPERKTLTPQIQRLMAKEGIGAPEEGKTLSAEDIRKITAGLDVSTRMTVKTGLARAGLISESTPA